MSMRLAPKPARRKRCAINAMSSWLAIPTSLHEKLASPVQHETVADTGRVTWHVSTTTPRVRYDGCTSRSPPCPSSPCLAPTCSSPLLHPAGSLLAGRTDDLIRKAYARHHQAIRQVPWRGWELHLLPVNIKNGPTQATHRVIMVLRRPVDAQTVTWAAHAATEPAADECIERLIHRGK